MQELETKRLQSVGENLVSDGLSTPIYEKSNEHDSTIATVQSPRVESRSSNQKRGNRKVGNTKTEDQARNTFQSKLIQVRRVSKMTKGGRTVKLSAFVVVGDGKGRFGLGVGKGDDVKQAQDKAIAQAKRNFIEIDLKGNTIAHDLRYKYKAARIILKPAKEGTGIVAGSSIRLIAEVAGIKDLYSKILGTNNKITNAYAMMNALKIVK